METLFMVFIVIFAILILAALVYYIGEGYDLTEKYREYVKKSKSGDIKLAEVHIGILNNVSIKLKIGI